MKKFLAILMSLNLILSPLAYSQGSGDQYRKGSTNDKGAVYADQIMGISNGIVGATVITKCKMASMQPSLMVFMAGGLAYIAKEVLGGKTQSDFHKAKAENLKMLEAKMVEGGDMQKASLYAALGDEEKNLKMIKQRRQWTKAIKAIYMTAAGLAAFEFWRSLPTPVGMNIPDQAMCTPDPAGTTLTTTLVAGAYSIASNVGGGSSVGMATGTVVAAAAADFIFKLGIGAKIADVASTVLSSALGRLAWFTAAAAIAAKIDSGLGQRQQIAQNNISLLRKVIAQFESETKSSEEISQGQVASAEAGVYDGNSNGTSALGNNYLDTPLFEDGAVARHCLSQANNGMDYSESGCKSSYKITRPRMDFSLNNPTLSTAANTAANFAQAIADGDMAQANVEAGNLNAMAGRLGEAKDGLLKEINDKLKSNGMKTLDVDDMAKKHLASMSDELYKEVAASGKDTDSLSKSAFGTDGDVAALDSLKEIKETQDVKAANGEALNIPAGVAQKDAGVNIINEGSLDGDLSKTDDVSLVATTLEEGLKNFEYQQNDISSKKEDSIFQQISLRYKMSYPKIMHKKPTRK